MPQGPLAVNEINTGTRSALNISAAAVVKSTPGKIVRITVNTVPSAGALTVNDCATTGAAAASNEILNVPYGDLTAGQVITLQWPCLVGIVLSAVGTSGVYAVSYV